ncbi:MAG: hypothetical protein J6A04_00650 [Clostridia bacterium]|nr:hypothetical protein [Clostridia bacterium]
MRREKGVTLTALVITTIVVLILAGITINLTVGQDGIITKAQQAAKEMKKAEIKDTMKLDILTAETEAKIRGEALEKAQLNDIVAKYGELQEDGDTIITKEDKFEISLKEIWYGVLSDSGSYTDKVEQIEILERELADLRKQYEELEKLNEGNVDVLNDLNKRIAELEEQKRLLEEQVATLTSEKEELTAENTRLEEALVKLNEEYQEFKKTEGTATAEDILSEKTAWVNGNKITGTMANRGALNWNPTSSTTYTVPAGYYSGGTLNSAGAYSKGVTDGRVGYYTKAQYDANYTNGYNAGYNAGYDVGKTANQIVYLGTGTSFDVSSYTGFENFTSENFIVGGLSAPDTLTSRYTTGAGNVEDRAAARGFSIQKNYNNTTGILTLSGTSQTVQIHKNSSGYSSWAATSQNITCFAYLVL